MVIIMRDVITAIATPPGSGGMAVIRVSGREIRLIDRVFKPRKGVAVTEGQSHLLRYGRVTDADGRTVDECMCVYMAAPHSFTGENVAEIHCHGGIFSTHKVMEALLSAGAHMAEPGEFTRRAFLNGRIDLIQAEAVADIIASRTDYALTTAVNHLEGALSIEINALREALTELNAQIDVSADYPEEDLSVITETEVRARLQALSDKMDALLRTAHHGRLLREGVTCAIAGRPNTGKSSVLNALVGQARAIVTDVAGTTRDIIEDYIVLADIPVRIADTAGIRAAADEVERIGVERARQYLQRADFCLLIIDASCALNQEDYEIIELLKEKKHIILLNKSDLPQVVTAESITSDAPIVVVSAQEGHGFDRLEEVFADMFAAGEVVRREGAMITKLRHSEALTAARTAVNTALRDLAGGAPLDLLFIELQAAASALGEITGMSVSDEIVDKIFSQFCLGK